MEVEAGKENMKFETGPFSYYGVMALNPTVTTSKLQLCFAWGGGTGLGKEPQSRQEWGGKQAAFFMRPLFSL